MSNANAFELSAELRSDTGRGASRRLRRYDNKVPAILYGAEKPPMTISLNHFHVLKALENEAVYSHILTLDINGEKHQAVLKDMQRHPFKPRVLHIDFLRVNPKEKLVMNVPLHFIGAEVAPGIVNDGGVVMHLLSSVEIRCLPANLPEFITVDISNLELDHTVRLADLQLPKEVELMAFTHGHAEEHNVGVVKIHIPRVAAEDEEVPAAAAATVEGAEGEVAPEAGAAPVAEPAAETKK